MSIHDSISRAIPGNSSQIFLNSTKTPTLILIEVMRVTMNVAEKKNYIP